MRRDPRQALLGAAACLAGLVLTGLVALLVPAARVRDAEALDSITHLDRGGLSALTAGLVHLADPKPYGIFGLGLILVALVRGRRRLAAVLPVVLFGSAVTTQLLKPLLATDRGPDWLDAHVGAASWPSGHSTAALTLALCLVLVAPRRLRPAAVVVGALFACAVAYAILIQAWHLPSDVLGGFLVATIWTLLGVAYLVAKEPERAPAEPRPAVLWPIELAFGVALGATLAVGLARPREIGTFAFDHTMGVAALGAIAALALALAGGVARTLRR